eukprot:TRINITY_DN1915_c0_g1_i2.p1 TRINITY_DN1915_c0_g1~~TRINITY_DN1915_c0_g1_i2.p1  ORF type:complete len:559 (+),score=147.87 TRINITY_DN1915_c0_g1_i2:266-1942(+)
MADSKEGDNGTAMVETTATDGSTEDSVAAAAVKERQQSRLTKEKYQAMKQESRKRMVESVPLPVAHRLSIEELYSSSSNSEEQKNDSSSNCGSVMVPNCSLLRDHFAAEGRLECSAASKLLEDASRLLSSEPSLLRLTAPFNVVGDLHGQYYDLLELFRNGGDPVKGERYLFLGDYVDRGSFSTETVLLLLALKIANPDRVFLLRGNHECRLLGSHFNFKLECKKKYNEQLYDQMMQTFDCLPLAATLTGSKGTFLCCHGGISGSLKTLEDIEKIERFQEPPKRGPLVDILWSDPLGEDSTKWLKSPADWEEWLETDFLPNPVRACGCFYGYAGVKNFLDKNNLISLVRGHEVKLQGYELFRFFQKNQDESLPPPVITVFSAPNYCETYNNVAAFLRYEDAGYRFVQFEAVAHPFCLPNFSNAFNYTLPFVIEKFIALIMGIFRVMEGEVAPLSEPIEPKQPVVEDNTAQLSQSSERRNAIRKKLIGMSKMMKMMATLREEREVIQEIKTLTSTHMLPKGILFGGHEAVQLALEAFKLAQQKDAINERRPICKFDEDD